MTSLSLFRLIPFPGIFIVCGLIVETYLVCNIYINLGFGANLKAIISRLNLHQGTFLDVVRKGQKARLQTKLRKSTLSQQKTYL